MTAGAVPAHTQQLAVVSRGGDALVFHDVTTGEQGDRIAVGDFPHEAVADTERRRIYVASYGSNTVHWVDTDTKTSGSFVLEDFASLHGLAVSAAGDVLWVTAEESQALVELNANEGTVLRVWKTNADLSHMVTVTPDDRKLYVANINSGSVSVIDRTSGRVIQVETGRGAEGIDISPDGSEVWVSNRGDNTLSVIDTETDRVVATMDVGGDFPVKVRFRPDGREVWVANNQSGAIAVFDRERRQLVATITVGTRPLGITFSDDSQRAYVTRPGANEVVEINAATKVTLRRISTGQSPDGVLWFR